MRAKMFAGLPDQPAKSDAGDPFKNFVRQVISVPRDQVKAKLDAEKKAKRLKPASRVSSDKG